MGSKKNKVSSALKDNSSKKPVKPISSFRNFISRLDPFYYVDSYVMPRVNPNNKESVSWVVNIFFAFIFAGLIYLFLGILFGVASPLVIVFSESMEPVLYRGDVVFLSVSSFDNVSAPEIIISEPISSSLLPDYAIIDLESDSISFPSSSNPTKSYSYSVDAVKDNSIITYQSFFGIPVIHRAILKIRAPDGLFVLSKGDNNPIPDNFVGEIFFDNRNNISISSSQLPILVSVSDLPQLSRSDIVPSSVSISDSSSDSSFYDSQAVCLCNREPNTYDYSFPEQYFSSQCSLCSSNLPITYFPISVSDLQGSSFGKLPFIGCVKLWLFDDLISLLATGKLPSNFKGFC